MSITQQKSRKSFEQARSKWLHQHESKERSISKALRQFDIAFTLKEASVASSRKPKRIVASRKEYFDS